MKKFKINISLIMSMSLFISMFYYACSPESEKVTDKSNEKTVMQSQVSDNQDNVESEIDRQNRIRESLKKELGDNYDKPLGKATKKQIASGKKVYQLKCAKCHGETGKGDGAYGDGLRIPPADLTDAKLASFYSDEARKQIIRKGIVGTTMVDWEKILTEQEIDDVYVFVKQFVTDNSEK